MKKGSSRGGILFSKQSVKAMLQEEKQCESASWCKNLLSLIISLIDQVDLGTFP